MSIYEYKQHRSKFWLKIYDDNDYVNIITTEVIKNIINSAFPLLEDIGPKGWCPTKYSPENYSLWIPRDRVDDDQIEALKNWSENANLHIWLGVNHNTESYFQGEELDYCVATDWNRLFGDSGNRTVVGEAEYQLKYPYARGEISEEQKDAYVSTLCKAIIDTIALLPIRGRNLLVCTIPATREEQHKLSWAIAHFVCNSLQAEFLNVALLRSKPKTKELSVNEKIEVWRKIYTENAVDLSSPVAGKNVIIVDDLYQSGASIWTYAEYLKNLGARKVIGVVAVKSQRDSDNK